MKYIGILAIFISFGFIYTDGVSGADGESGRAGEMFIKSDGGSNLDFGKQVIETSDGGFVVI